MKFFFIMIWDIPSNVEMCGYRHVHTLLRIESAVTCKSWNVIFQTITWTVCRCHTVTYFWVHMHILFKEFNCDAKFPFWYESLIYQNKNKQKNYNKLLWLCDFYRFLGCQRIFTISENCPAFIMYSTMTTYLYTPHSRLQTQLDF